MEFEKRKKISTDLKIAPLIDMVFLLLIFFMLSADFAAQPGIKLTLPRAVSSKPQADEDITVFIAGSNDLYLNGVKVTMDGLLERLKPMILFAKKKTIVIKADEGINLGLAVKVMDIAKQAEAEGVVISTKRENDAKR